MLTEIPQARLIPAPLETKLAVLVYYLQQVRSGYRQSNPLGVNSLLDDAEVCNWVDQMNRDGKIPPRL